MNGNYRLFIFKRIMLLGFVLAAYPTLSAFAGQIRYYVVISGASERYCYWQLEKNRNFINTIEMVNKKDTVTIQTGFDTLEWKLEAPFENTDITAVKRDNTIDLVGLYKGKAIHKVIEIDQSPWFQSLSVSLKPIISSEISKHFFWSIRPDNLKAYKMVAIKKGRETISLDRQQISAIRIEIRPHGILAPFWKCDCWFSEEGVFLKYKGDDWSPGSPGTQIEYRETTPAVADRVSGNRSSQRTSGQEQVMTP